ncbi:MAG: glycosyltransferase family 4 protein [Gemmatimonadota bacterium]|nr:glycosyltransferase family 4 protein [Gemmatimonadota bacterium]
MASSGLRVATASPRRSGSAGVSDPLRPLFFHWNGDLYGASRSLLRLTSRLARDGHRPVVVLGQPGPLAALLAGAGVEVRRTGWMAALERSDLKSPLAVVRFLGRALASIPVYLRILAQVRPGVVHTNASIVITSGLAARLMGRPHVWHMRETYGDFPRLWPVFQRFVAILSTRVVCISECVAAQFSPAIRERKVDVIHNGIPQAELRVPDENEVERLRRHWGLLGHSTVGVVGRINLGRKGQHLLVEAAARLAAQHPSARFLIIGSAYPGKEHEESHLRALIKERGLTDRFVLTGDMGDLPLIYGLLDVLVVPSPVPEPFGNTAPEAMAYGIPVVGTDLGGTAEIVTHGQTGFLFPPDDAEALAACIDVLLGDPGLRRRLGDAGRGAFRDRFEFERCYRGMIDVLTRARGRRPSNPDASRVDRVMPSTEARP